MKPIRTAAVIIFLFPFTLSAQKKKEKIPDPEKTKQEIIQSLNSKYDYYKERALKIWDYAEIGYK